MRRAIYIYFIVLFCVTCSVAQNKNVDSLKILLQRISNDTSKANYYNLIGIELWKTGDYDKGLLYADSAMRKSQAAHFKKGMAMAYDSYGTINWYKGNYPIALKNYLEALKIRDVQNNEAELAVSYNNIGMVYLYQGEFNKALEYYKKALQIFDIKYKINSADKKIMNGLAASYNNIGNTYYSMSNINEALQSFLVSLKIRKEIGEQQGIAASYNNIAILYEELGDFSKAISYYNESLKIMEAIGDKESLAGFYLNIGTLYIKQHKLNEARKSIGQTLMIAAELKSKLLFKEGYFALSSIDSVANDFSKALINYKLYIAYRDSLINEGNTEKSIQLQMNYAFEKKEMQAKAEQEKLDEINVREKQKQQIIFYSVIGVLILVLSFTWFIYKRFKVSQNQKRIIVAQKTTVDHAYQELHEKNKEVLDSIYYAQKIQRALLTPEKYIDKALNKLNKNKLNTNG